MRTPRNEEIATERRRRKADTLDRINGLKLELPPELAEAEDRGNWHYYWANDVGSRVYDLTVNDDYDPATLSKAEATDGDRVKRPVGQNDDGSPTYAVLLRKPMHFHLEDQKAKDRRLRDQEKQLATRAQVDASGNAAPDLVVREASIKHGGYTP